LELGRISAAAIKALSCCLVVGFCLVLPLYFEPKIATSTTMGLSTINSTHVFLVNMHLRFLKTVT
jgi:hypothetical protein